MFALPCPCSSSVDTRLCLCFTFHSNTPKVSPPPARCRCPVRSALTPPAGMELPFPGERGLPALRSGISSASSRSTEGCRLRAQLPAPQRCSGLLLKGSRAVSSRKGNNNSTRAAESDSCLRSPLADCGSAVLTLPCASRGPAAPPHPSQPSGRSSRLSHAKRAPSGDSPGPTPGGRRFPGQGKADPRSSPRPPAPKGELCTAWAPAAPAARGAPRAGPPSAPPLLRTQRCLR